MIFTIILKGKLTAQGKLLLQDTLLVGEVTPGKPELKLKERRIFLFEQIVIFGEVIESKNALTQPHYVFKNSIKVGTIPYVKNFSSWIRFLQ